MFTIGVLCFIFGCLLSIALHEFGHLIFGKIFKVKVYQYMIGFGPKIFSKIFNSTEYGIRMMPFGGYISMAGMYPPINKPKETNNKKSIIHKLKYFKKIKFQIENQSRQEVKNNLLNNKLFYQLPYYKRIIIMISGPFMNLFLGILFISMSTMNYGISQPTNTVSKVYECLIKKENEVNKYKLTAINSDECYKNDGVLSPAAKINLKKGDEITKFASVEITGWNQLNDLISKNTEKEVNIEFLRNNNLIVNKIHPIIVSINKDEGSKNGFIGIVPAFETVKQSFISTLKIIYISLKNMFNLILKLPIQLFDLSSSIFKNEKREINSPISIIGAGRLMGEIAAKNEIKLQSKIAILLNILGTLNLGIFVFNLIPLLPFDGGHILSIILESIKNLFYKFVLHKEPQPFNALKLLPMTYLVTVFLILMSIVLIYADIVKPISLFN